MSPIGPINPGGGGGDVSSVFSRTGAVVAAADDYTAEQIGSSGVPEVFNVKTYGAVGDGSTDDTTAIQNALTAADTAGGGDVWFPYTADGYLCEGLILGPGVRMVFANGAKLVATASLAAPWISLTAGEVHDGTSIINGTFDASATTSADVTAVLYLQGISSDYTSCPNIRIIDNTIINAPVHGIFLGGEATPTYDKKWICRNAINGHGTSGGGYGIYADYIGSVEIHSNYVTQSAATAYDSIELGHSGPAWIGIEAHMRATNNTMVYGQLQFPFSDYCEMIGNTIIDNTIQNDTNTANHVCIIGNTVLNATPASGYAGIRVDGNYALVTGNHVEVTTEDGISIVEGSSNCAIVGNWIASTIASSDSGAGLHDNGTTSTENLWNDNVVLAIGDGDGFTYGAEINGQFSQVAGNFFEAFDGLNLSSMAHGLVADNLFQLANSGLAQAPAGTSVLRGNSIQPIGAMTVSVPASGTAVAASYVDRMFYITAKDASTTAEVGTASLGTLAESVITPIFVPAGVTMTMTYTTAPTWECYGN